MISVITCGKRNRKASNSNNRFSFLFRGPIEVTGLSKYKSIKTHQLLLSTEIFSKRRKIYPHFEEMPEYTPVKAQMCLIASHLAQSVPYY